jgi:hypothetical protein
MSFIVRMLAAEAAMGKADEARKLHFHCCCQAGSENVVIGFWTWRSTQWKEDAHERDVVDNDGSYGDDCEGIVSHSGETQGQCMIATRKTRHVGSRTEPLYIQTLPKPPEAQSYQGE